MIKLGQERRRFAIHNEQLIRVHKQQKEKADQLEEAVKKKDKYIRELEEVKRKLEDDLEKTIESYKQLLFQAHKYTQIAEETEEEKGSSNGSEDRGQGTVQQTTGAKKRNGQKKGHKGFGRKNPEIIDRQAVRFLAVCPDCGSPVERGKRRHSHTVTDIPHWTEMKPVTTAYTIEYQWCGHCHKAVSAVPAGVIPGARIGLNLFLMILIWRYYLRLPFKKISEILFMQYKIYLSSGAIVGITRRARQFFGKRYDDLLCSLRSEERRSSMRTRLPGGWMNFSTGAGLS